MERSAKEKGDWLAKDPQHKTRNCLHRDTSYHSALSVEIVGPHRATYAH